MEYKKLYSRDFFLINKNFIFNLNNIFYIFIII